MTDVIQIVLLSANLLATLKVIFAAGEFKGEVKRTLADHERRIGVLEVNPKTLAARR
jgi:hypothetical protein